MRGRRRFEAACLAGGVEPPEELSSAGVASSRGAGLLAGGRRRARLSYFGARRALMEKREADRPSFWASLGGLSPAPALPL
jgi:hypothetical protein